MKFRFYQLMYVASLALTVLALFSQVAAVRETDGAVAQMTNFKYIAPDGEISRSVIALGILLVFTAVVNFLGLFVSLYNNFELQKRSSILSVLLLTGYYILLLIYILLSTYFSINNFKCFINIKSIF